MEWIKLIFGVGMLFVSAYFLYQAIDMLRASAAAG